MPVVILRGCAPLLRVVSVFVFLSVGTSAVLGAASASRDGKLHTYRIAPLVIRTDLAAADTIALARRVKAVLDNAATYWRRPARGPIECYVVGDLARWEDYQLPHPLARLIITRVGGATHARHVGHGVHARNMACVFASARPGIVEHEIVHAYCGQTFCATGPVWYQEGMAQLFAIGTDRREGVNCPPDMLAQLRAKPSMTVAQIRSGDRATQRLIRQFSDKTNRCAGLAGLIPIKQWDRADVRALEEIQHFYCWNWFLCHFLYHNTNYRSKFRKVGQQFLAQRQDYFGAMFQPVWRQLEFEYNFTLAHLARGYRVDLCSWDWDKPFHQLAQGRVVALRVTAARGYQATGVQVEAGQSYKYRADGGWTHSPRSADARDSAGAASDQCLEAVIMHDYQLSSPIVLDCHCSGSFRATCSGCLYVRCRERWDRLADNEGSVTLTIAR